MAKNQIKRKATVFVEKKKNKDAVVKSADEDEEDLEEDLLQKISNQDQDSTDDEGVNENYQSDESDELEFESDEEGNYASKWDEGIESENDSFEEEESAEEGSEEEVSEGEDEINESDIEDISEEDNDHSSDESGDDFGDESDNDGNTKATTKKKPENNISEKENSPKPTTSKGAKKALDAQTPGTSQAFNNFQKELKDTKETHAVSDKKTEYEDSDTSDEEDIRNTVGNIPMRWYDEYKHIGYDWDAKKIIKPPKGDQIDDFLRKIEDPDFWRSVKDPQTGQEVVLTDEDIALIKRINSSRVPNPVHNEYENWIEWFTSEVERMPIKNVPDHKRSFLPSSSERKKVSRMVHAIKMGWMKTTEEVEREKKAARGPKFYMLWETDTSREQMRRVHDPVSAPKRDLPGHAESYNPPPEYLFDEKEEKEWLKLKDEPHKRKLHFMPQKYKSLREVPAYPRYIRERFLRCLDLYLCPRARRTRLNIDAEYLIPKLPSPKDLQPFPTVESLVYRGHTDLVRSISVEPKGEYVVSGSDDKTVKIWEIVTGRCIRTIETDEVVRCVAWCPNAKLSIIAVASGNKLLLINPKVGDKMLVKKTDDLLAEAPKIDTMESERIKTAVQWSVAEKEEQEKGVRLVITHFKPIQQVTWHGRGDYVATVMPEGANRSALIHQLSKRRSQIPFSKSKGLIQCVLFHPIKPCLFVATQHNVRIYDLVKQELIKKLLTNSKWISGMAIHPKGDNLLVSTYDKKMLWFDLDLSTKPYQTIRLHRNAVRSVAFHLRYPLFASASDDLSVIVSHGMVYNDLLQNPLIVPLKKLQTHEAREEFGVLGVAWHPVQPWVFSSGADATIRLYT
ncbi:PREDICTED: ribosome biogenesis protein BOP1 homolog [Rhagoletis zephyria]|uniref:ribosome biogenesis protein BOP1 homolog n=1 Tax=Rhagoletis zephyria TaxID=28612 RepID=UPI000811A20C|nr:PREDICTED: ribosome biogenesis protein BOP1 homolog [Rhagoletis zephyria]